MIDSPLNHSYNVLCIYLQAVELFFENFNFWSGPYSLMNSGLCVFLSMIADSIVEEVFLLSGDHMMCTLMWQSSPLSCKLWRRFCADKSVDAVSKWLIHEVILLRTDCELISKTIFSLCHYVLLCVDWWEKLHLFSFKTNLQSSKICKKWRVENDSEAIVTYNFSLLMSYF